MQKSIPSPCFILDESTLEDNLKLIHQVSKNAGVEIILAFKGFAMWIVFPLVRQYISGAAASSLHEVMLCHEQMKTKAHTYAVAYRGDEIDEILQKSSHITFNSLSQLNQFKKKSMKAKVSMGLRINPEFSDVEVDLYNPSSSISRLGMTKQHLGNGLPSNVEGLHFHVLCESDSYALENTLQAIEDKFGYLLPHVKWVNFGGGHLITKKGYDTDHLVSMLRKFKSKWKVDIILEPGSAFAWEAGVLKTTLLDIVENGAVSTAIIDASFTCHMPDCLEMPYRPNISSGYEDVTKGKYRYRLGGVSCLAGDFLEEYSFDLPLSVGDEITFLDMIHYTMVKTSTFNGIQHPAIGIRKKTGEFELVKTFGYSDYRNRLS